MNEQINVAETEEVIGKHPSRFGVAEEAALAGKFDETTEVPETVTVVDDNMVTVSKVVVDVTVVSCVAVKTSVT